MRALRRGASGGRPMDTRRLLGNFGVAAAAQGMSLLLSVLVSFMVPKLLGAAEFGYWQLFVFYTSYSGFFLLGINDGIYLINGGKTAEQLDRRSVASQFLCGMMLQAAFAVIVGILGMCLVNDHERSFVLVMTGAYLLVSNAAGFLGYVFQAINETRWYSESVIISKASLFAMILALVFSRVLSVEVYIVAYFASQCFALAYCAVKARFLFDSGLLPLVRAAVETLASARVGISLTLANIASMLVLGVARFVVDSEWGIEAFGQFSFALTLENFFLVFISQLAMVLFPALRQSSIEEKKRWFVRLRDGLSLLLPLTYALYFPMSAVVRWWLPAYSDAVDYLSLLLPICVFESKMSLVGTTYYKVLRGERRLLAVNAATVMVSAAGVFLGVYAIGSLEFVMVWVTASIALRSIYSEHWVGARMAVGGSKLWLQELFLTVVFVAASRLLGFAPAAGVVFAAEALYFLLNRSIVRSVAGKVRA